mgnify:CR=1 FL=1
MTTVNGKGARKVLKDAAEGSDETPPSCNKRVSHEAVGRVWRGGCDRCKQYFAADGYHRMGGAIKGVDCRPFEKTEAL